MQTLFASFTINKIVKDTKQDQTADSATLFPKLKEIHIIFLLGIAVFFNCLFNGFVGDDKTFILFNPEVHQLNFWSALHSSYLSSNGRFLPVLAFYDSLVYFLSGGTPFLFHLMQVFFHTANTFLVFLFYKKWLPKKLALFLALIFLVHSIQVEAVVYISATNNPLSFLLGMSAFLLSIRENASKKSLIGLAILLFVALLIKETTLLFFLLIVVYAAFFNKKNVVHYSVMTGICLVLYGMLRFTLVGVSLTGPESVPIAALPLMSRLWHIPSIILFYLKTFLFPATLSVEQLWTIKTLTTQNFYVPLLIDSAFLTLILAFGGYLLKKRRVLLPQFIFFFIWFTGGLGMYLQIFPLDATVADRFFYYPLAGLLGLLGMCGSALYPRLRYPRAWMAIGVVLLTILSIRTMVRNANWAGNLTLYSHDSSYNTNYDMENTLGLEYAAKGNSAQAIEHFTRSIALYPYEATYSNLAHTYDQVGEETEAERAYQQTLHAPYTSSKLHKLILKDTDEHLARLYIISKKYKIAKDFIPQALKQYPNSGILWAYLAITQYHLGNQVDALAAAEKAKLFSPGSGTDLLYTQILNKQLPETF